MNKIAAIEADTVYCENELIARDVALTLPEVSFQTADIQAMGSLTLPLYGLIDNMETTIMKVGYDKGLSRMLKLETQEFEFRWIEAGVTPDGKRFRSSCKTFLKLIPLKIPGKSIEPGGNSEAEGSYTTLRMQTFVDGEEYICVDRLAHILRINGVDYMEEINSLL